MELELVLPLSPPLLRSPCNYFLKAAIECTIQVTLINNDDDSVQSNNRNVKLIQ
jgi:hypothetical protein